MKTENTVYEKEYLPFIIRWGRFTTWGSLLLIFLPLVVLVVFYGARPPLSAIFSGLVATLSAYAAWYIVDPVSLFPILGVPGMYITYIAGNSKEIRIPAAVQALAAANVQGGTPEGTIISTLAIATSVMISICVMTVFAIGGNFVLGILPPSVIKSLHYLLPALFGAMLAQRLIASPLALAVSGCVLILCMKYLNINGVFKVLPLGGSYAQVLLCVIGCMFLAKYIAESRNKKKNTTASSNAAKS